MDVKGIFNNVLEGNYDVLWSQEERLLLSNIEF